jgi:hypothetical protein
MSGRKPLAALAAVAATVALAVPVASASAATTAPAVRTTSLAVGLVPGSLPCVLLLWQSQRARLWSEQFGNAIYRVFLVAGCGIGGGP